MENIKVEERTQDRVVVITLDRPKVRNALNRAMLTEIAETLEAVAANDTFRVVVLTGGEEVFAAGADLKEMADLDMVGVMHDPRSKLWRRITAFPKPMIAAVNGYALGGGCELAMQADIVIAGEGAQFGQPEINLGIIPGAGGTQRLVRAVGKSLAMKMILSGLFIDAETAVASGLAAEVVPPAETLERALKLARRIATKSPLALEMAKQSVLSAFETPLADGLEYERKAFIILAGTQDRAEGIAAFLEKRDPDFKGK
ncbi:MAG: 2,3-dehydroadipyl-CoA hydratase [Alphaproteobacteria bacterium]|nr:2,3-dehydroadipyl-CoA hydratase [Alphaproteobacteria bacterium]